MFPRELTFCFVFFSLAGIADSRAAQRDRPPAEIALRVTSLDLPDLCIVTCMAVATDGTRLLCTPLALYTLSIEKREYDVSCRPHDREGLHGFKASRLQDFKDGQGGAGRFAGLTSIAVDGAGNVFVADSFNHVLRKVTRNGAVSTLAGNGEAGYADGAGDADTLQHTATHCNTLQHTATHCNTLQHTATHCNTRGGRCRTLQ